jgi:uncharacterized protein
MGEDRDAAGAVDAAPRFLCDAMLAQLAHWLRAAGHDALLASRSSDRALLARAHADRRLLLTRDRQLCALREARGRAVLLRADRLPAQAAEVAQALAIDWLQDPFSRCLVCNVELRRASALARQRLEPGVHAAFDEINHCPQCDRLYWPGGHVRRMRARLERWRAGVFE